MHEERYAALHTCCVIAAMLGIAPAIAQEWKPERNVDMVVNSGAGGASDRQARFVQRALQTLPGMPSMTVTNRTGGGGIVALTFINQQPGDAHFLSTLSTGIVTNHITGVTKLSFRDVTPLNVLMREYVVATVRADSQITSAKDLLARIKKDPTSVSFGFATARGNQNHIVIGMFARAAGVDPKLLKTVIFASGAQGLTAVLGGHIDMLVGTPGTVLPHVETGKVRVLGISAATRQPGKQAALPTFREQGIDAVYYAWRGFLLPRGVTPAQVAFWEQAFAKIAQAENWKKDLEDNAWSDDLRGAAETRKHLETEHELLSRMLVDLGVIAR